MQQIDSKKYADSLRLLADFYDAHPETPVDDNFFRVPILAPDDSNDPDPVDTMAAFARAALSTPGAQFKVNESHDTLCFIMYLGAIELMLFADKEVVCERITRFPKALAKFVEGL